MNKSFYLLTIAKAVACLALLRAQDVVIDPMFNNGAGPNAAVGSLELQSDGKILIGGDFTQINGIEMNRLARLNQDGSLDSEFQVGAGFDRHVSGILIDRFGRVVVVGDFHTVNQLPISQIVRLTTNGAIDTSFVWRGQINGRISCAVLQQDGKIIIGGSFDSLDGSPKAYVARLNTDGSVDTTFNGGVRPNNAMESGIDVMAIQNDGKLVVGGTFDVQGQSSNLARLNADGTLDSAFSGDAGAILYFSFLRIDPPGRILIGGMASPTGAGFARRLMPDRSVDTAFRTGLTIDNPARAIAPLPNGKFMIAGSFSEIDGVTNSGLARLNADGTVDAAFHLSAQGVSTLTAQADGAVLIGGNFDQINGVSRHFLARVRPGGGTPSGSATISGGPVKMTWKAISGQSYRIEASSDLQNWSLVDTVIATSDHIEFVDSDWSANSKRFFRLVPQT